MDEKYYYVVAVKDELTNAFLQPTFGDNMDELKRIFKTQINTIPLWRENASDFSFYQLGFYDPETGELIGNIEKIVSGHSVKEEK